MRQFFRYDALYVSAIALLVGFGTVALWSALVGDGDAHHIVFSRHVAYVVLGAGLFWLFARVDYSALRSYSTALYFFSIVILLVTLFFGTTVRGTSGWLNLGFTVVQPVEIVKIFMIIFLAHFISDKRGELGEVASIVVSFVLVAVVGALVLLQPDFGSALVIFGIWFGMVVVSGIRKRYLALFVVLGAVAALVAWQFFAPYQRDRVLDFLHPERDPRGSGYNVLQSMIAVGNGGVVGRGFGYGSQSRLNFLPEKHTDFIFATVVEAVGFVGTTILFLLYTLLFTRFFLIANHARDGFGYFLAVGVMVLFFIHFAINVGMNIGVLPVTGIPLPLISYGGSSLVSMLIACGIVMSVYVRREATMTNYIESY